MNSPLALQEEKQSTSSVEVDVVPKYRIPHTSLDRFRDSVTTGTLVLMYDIHFDNAYFVTTPRVDISGLYKADITVPRIRVVHKKRASVDALLGDKGRLLLANVIDLAEDASLKQNWPLNHVEVIYVEDAEVENWQYVLILLVFDCYFEGADEYLYNFYEELDTLADALDSEEQDILQRKLFFDVATTV